jgi:hypothetical protein
VMVATTGDAEGQGSERAVIMTDITEQEIRKICQKDGLPAENTQALLNLWARGEIEVLRENDTLRWYLTGLSHTPCGR